MLGIWKSSNKNWASAVKGKNALTKLGDDSGKRLFLPQNLVGIYDFLGWTFLCGFGDL
jgi:hypothetical protein